jgi:hypothetical protein
MDNGYATSGWFPNFCHSQLCYFYGSFVAMFVVAVPGSIDGNVIFLSDSSS